MADVVEKAWQRYLIALQKYPLRTKATTAGVLAGCSDLVAQKLSGAKKLQLRRSLLMLLYGFVYGGPFGHFFHKLMERLFPRRDTPTLVKKVLVEQLTSGPWNNFVFMLYMGLVIEGRPWRLVKNKLRTDYPVVQLNAWRVWPLVSFINYYYMPIHLRVLFHNLAAVCWGTFLILRSTRAIKQAA
jgi:peroxisomal membrane protein 2